MLDYRNLSWTTDSPLSTSPTFKEKRLIAHQRDPEDLDQFSYMTQHEEIAALDAQSGEPPLFVSYFTENTPYEALADQLRRSLDAFDLPHRIEPIPSRGSWVSNTGLKSNFIAKAWSESDRPICWIDADAEVLRPPKFVFDNPFDIAMVRRHGWYDISSLVYLGKSEVTGDLLTEWVRLCDTQTHVWDQVLLTLAWYRTARTSPLASLFLNDGIFRFPRPWIRDARDRLFYYPTQKKIRPFVDQKQASRQLKEFVNKSKRPQNERGSDDINASFRQALVNFDFDHNTEIDAIFE